MQETKTIQSIDRAISILKCYYEEASLGITELSRQTGLHKSTVSNIVITLEANGFLSQHGDTKKYSLGPELCRLAANVNVDIRNVAYPYIRGIMQQCRETVNLGVRDGNHVVYLDIMKGPHAIASSANPGMRFPLYSTAFGRAILAFLPKEERDELIQATKFQSFTAHSVSDPVALEQLLQEIREVGYAVNHEEVEYGQVCVAAPIFNYKNYPIASISVSGPSMRMSEEKVKEIGGILVEKTGEISGLLGYEKKN